jgi:hypothetical protein
MVATTQPDPNAGIDLDIDAEFNLDAVTIPLTASQPPPSVLLTPPQPLPRLPPRTLVVHMRYLISPSVLERIRQRELDAAQQPMCDCVASILAAQRQRFDFVYLLQEPVPTNASIAARNAIEAVLQAQAESDDIAAAMESRPSAAFAARRSQDRSIPAASARRRIRLLPSLSASFAPPSSSPSSTSAPSSAISSAIGKDNPGDSATFFFNGRSLGDDRELAATLHELAYVSTGEAFVHTLFSSFGTLAQAAASAARNGTRRDAWVVRLGAELAHTSLLNDGTKNKKKRKADIEGLQGSAARSGIHNGHRDHRTASASGRSVEANDPAIRGSETNAHTIAPTNSIASKESNERSGGGCATTSGSSSSSPRLDGDDGYITIHNDAGAGQHNCRYTRVGAEPYYPHLSRAFSSCGRPYRPVHGAAERTVY